MYATEYDLMVAQDQLRNRRDEMRAIHLARLSQADAISRPSLLDRIVAFVTGGTRIEAQRKVGAAV